jgi:hypothetical protein
MFSRDIEYVNFKGVKRTKRLYFNLTAPEILGLEFEFDEGFEKYIEQAAASGSNKMLFVMFELIVAKSYGRFAPDGETFVKKPEWHHELLPSKEYEELFLWIFASESNASAFYNHIVPKDLPERLAKLRGENAEPSNKPKLQEMSLAELEAQVALIKAGGLKPANEA